MGDVLRRRSSHSRVSLNGIHLSPAVQFLLSPTIPQKFLQVNFWLFRKEKVQLTTWRPVYAREMETKALG